VIGYLPLIFREVLGPRQLTREPEPRMVMDEREQVTAYAAAGRLENATLASLLFHSAHCSETISGARRVVDLGCGPATQLVHLARLNPKTEFLGVDLSERMLEEAAGEVARAGVDNVRLRKADITRLSFLGDASVDAAISTMTLHHLPAQEDLDRLFDEVRRVLRPGGAVYIVDFARLKCEASVRFFAHMDSDTLALAVIQDYERSLRAAFALDDLRRQLARLPAGSKLHSTFLVPLLAILHTPKRRLSVESCTRLQAMRRALPPRILPLLDDLRRFFRLGGLQGDPFAPRSARTLASVEPVLEDIRAD